MKRTKYNENRAEALTNAQARNAQLLRLIAEEIEGMQPSWGEVCTARSINEDLMNILVSLTCSADRSEANTRAAIEVRLPEVK